MNQNFSVKKWPCDMSLEEICLDVVPFWVQIKGLPLNFCTKSSAKRLAFEVGGFVEMEDPTMTRGFLRVKT